MSTDYQQLPTASNRVQHPVLFTLVPIFLWVLFSFSFLTTIFFFDKLPVWEWKQIFKVNGFSLLIWTTVSFFSAIVSSYSKNYLKGFLYHKSFTWYSLGFTLSVMTLVMANHIILFFLSWLLMGVFMERLIGVNAKWAEAKAASKYAQKFFLLGSLLLGIALTLLSWYSDEISVFGIAEKVHTLPVYVQIIAALCIILAAVIQSAIYPFQRWLMSAMTSPTPASALMHAGFVNGGGILLAFFSSLLFASDTLNLLFIIGGVTAVMAQFTKLLQVNVKQKLACSTIAQMGFMIMQCGLGFFNAAVAHLILHGFYKAYLFLSAGEEIKQKHPAVKQKLHIKPLQAVVVLIFGAMGAVLFSYLTGKGTAMDSGIILTLIVAITVGQATYNMVKEKSLNTFQKIVYPLVLFSLGIVLYAGLYNAVTIMMSQMPLTYAPVEMSWIHIVFGIAFLIGFFLMKLGAYRKIPWLYVKLMNDSQPYHKTIFTSKK